MKRRRKDQVVMIDDNYINLEQFFDCSYKAIPKSYRSEDEGLIHVNTYNAEVGDLACDPRSGGIGGIETIAEYYGVGEQQFRKNILPHLTYIRWYAGRPVTHTWSAEADGARYQNEMHAKRYENLHKEVYCDVTGNWI